VRIRSLDHVVLTVADVDRTAEWYGRVLAFGSQKLNLHQAGREFEPKAARPTPGSADLCFITDVPLDDAIAELQRAGVAVELGPVPKTGARRPLRSVYVRDPDGNLIEIANEL